MDVSQWDNRSSWMMTMPRSGRKSTRSETRVAAEILIINLMTAKIWQPFLCLTHPLTHLLLQPDLIFPHLICNNTLLWMVLAAVQAIRICGKCLEKHWATTEYKILKVPIHCCAYSICLFQYAHFSCISPPIPGGDRLRSDREREREKDRTQQLETQHYVT